jgi:hypothetical protein
MASQREPCDGAVTIRVTEGLVHLRRDRPQPSRLRFTGAHEGWPPRPADQKEVKPIHSADLLGLPREELIEEITQAASHDERVRAVVGERYAHLHTDLLAFGKRQSREHTEQPRTRVLFYSYTHRLAVEVTMRGTQVLDVFPLRGFQPAEGWDEVQAAIEIARRDERLRARVEGLDGHGILLPLSEEQGKDHARLLWVTFTELSPADEELPALYAAIVDLIEQTVVVVRTDLTRHGALRHA